MAATTTKTLPAAGQLGDLVQNIYNPGYNFVSSLVTAPAGMVATPGMRLLGQPVKVSGAKFILVLSADIANASGVIADDGLYDVPAAAADIAVPLNILKRGPANVGAEALAANDVLAVAIAQPAFATALATNCNPPLIVRPGFSPTKTQVN